MNVHKLSLPTGAKREIARVLADGWELSAGGKHWKLRRPGVGVVIISTSSSDHAIEAIVRRDIRRLEAK